MTSTKWYYRDVVARLISDVQQLMVFGNPFTWLLNRWLDVLPGNANDPSTPRGVDLVEAANETYNTHLYRYLVEDLAIGWDVYQSLLELDCSDVHIQDLPEDLFTVLETVMDLRTVGLSMCSLAKSYLDEYDRAAEQLAKDPVSVAINCMTYECSKLVEEHEEALARLTDCH